MKTHTFELGEYCEQYPWEIQVDSDEEHSVKTPCKHAIPSGGGLFKLKRVVVAYNEAQCNQTCVCLDCILEAAKTVELQNKD